MLLGLLLGLLGTLLRLALDAGALALLEDDPFQQAGYIAERIPREWNPVIGVLA